jgi:hypothetical protein
MKRLNTLNTLNALSRFYLGLAGARRLNPTYG